MPFPPQLRMLELLSVLTFLLLWQGTQKHREQKKRFYILNLHLVSGVQYRNIAAIVQSNVQPPKHLQEHFQMFLYEEFLGAVVELGQMKTGLLYQAVWLTIPNRLFPDQCDGPNGASWQWSLFLSVTHSSAVELHINVRSCSWITC